MNSEQTKYEAITITLENKMNAVKLLLAFAEEEEISVEHAALVAILGYFDGRRIDARYELDWLNDASTTEG